MFTLNESAAMTFPPQNTAKKHLVAFKKHEKCQPQSDYEIIYIIRNRAKYNKCIQCNFLLGPQPLVHLLSLIIQ